MTFRNRSRYRNRLRLPVILFFVITCGLVSARWIKEVRAHNLETRLSVQLRQLNHDIVRLRRDIGDLKGRETALLTKDALDKRLEEQGVQFELAGESPIIQVSTPAPTSKVAQTQTTTP